MQKLERIHIRISLLIAVGYIACCTLHAQDYEITEAPFNSEEADFSGAFNGNQFVFSSTRAKTNLSFLEDTIQAFFTDLYVVEINADGEFGKANALKGNVNTLHNEGQATFSPSGNLMIYTGNVKNGKTNKFQKVEEFKLGLFTAERFKDNWLITAEFPYNSRDGKFSVAHPCLSDNDSVLYFASNMPGGYGGSDIYRSFWKSNMWSVPENLGKNINTKGNEFFPFINEFGILFFSTNAREDSEGMDIYYSTEEKKEFIEPQRLNGSINSEYDEFAYSEKPGVHTGTFSSNRNDGVDDIFFFAKYINNFQNCHNNDKPYLCYHIVDEKLLNVDSLPFKYEWNLGDGTVLHGNEVDHCYKAYGKYTVTLNVIDTTTKQVFAKVSRVEINCMAEDKPYIITHDTIYANVPFECLVDLNEFKGFEVEKIEWELNDGSQFRTKEFTHQFKQTGSYQIKCGLIGKKKGKIYPRICVFKDIVVINKPIDKILPAVLACCDLVDVKYLVMKQATMLMDSAGKRLSPFYRLVIAQSGTPIAEEDKRFTMIAEEISELKTELGYEYSIEQAMEWSELIPIYEGLKKAGFTSVYAELMSEAEYKHQFVKVLEKMKGKDASLKAPTFGDSLKIADNRFRISLLKSKVRVDFSNPYYKNVNAEITEIKADEGFEYIVADAASFEELQNKLDELKREGFTTAEIQEFSNEEFDKSILKKGFYQAAEKEKTFKIMLSQTKEPMTFNDVAFSKVEQEITETKTAEGYAYIVESATNYEDLSEKLNALKREGFTNAEIQEFSIEEFEKSILKKGFYQAAEKEKTFKIMLAQTKEPMAFNDVAFSKVEQEITEIKTAEGYAYIVESAANYEDLSAVLDDLKSEGFNSAVIKEFSTDEFEKVRLKSGRYSTEDSTKNKLQDRQIYTLVIAESIQRLPFNSKVFAGIDENIIELKMSNGEGYLYAIRNVSQKEDLNDLLKQMSTEGRILCYIDSLTLPSFDARVSKIGKYIAPKNPQGLNVEFSKLSDIKFEYNSAEIKPESFANLNYIASMLIIEEGFSLRLGAHTCNVGGAPYNKDLSAQRAQSVLEYFVSKGIERSRIFPKGHGLEKPKSSNKSDEGRKINRRVEFTVVFNSRITP